MGGQDGPARQSGQKKSLLLQAILCVLCTLVGAFYPTFLDLSKTAFEKEAKFVDGSVQTQERRAYPFSPSSVVFVNDALQLFIAVCVVSRKEGLSSLWADGRLVLKMIPLGFIYAMGELLTLRSIAKGSGPVYVVIANMKLVVAAVMSRLLFGRAWSMPWLHWLELVLISLAAAAYTLAEAGSLGSQWHWEGAWMALAKSSLVAFSSVFCEHTYKNNAFHTVLTLQAFWGLVSIMLLIGSADMGFFGSSTTLVPRDENGVFSLFAGGSGQALCASAAHANCMQQLSHNAAAVCSCITRQGWDTHTLLTVVADLSNAVSSALVFKRLSAVSKYVCRATSAVPMYIFYCSMGRSSWDFRVFAVVIYLCAQVGLYTWQRHQADKAATSDWTRHYGAAVAGPAADKKRP
mmetsp:Transcript_59941/g.128647  ORF Transcript_59941/g.128647 Transcript_59941/m.128647 type:complete len:405 (-) Transcript_59941:65-1279(-)